MKSVVYLIAALGLLALGACESIKFKGDDSGGTMPWTSPEGFESAGAGTPFGAMGGLQGR